MIEIIGALAPLATLLIGFFLGQYAEKRKQSLAVRSDMLKPIEEWLAAAERVNAILGDTLGSVMIAEPLPIMYDHEERLKTAKSMIEKSNIVFGILQSDSLKTWRNRELVHELNGVIGLIDSTVRVKIMPLDNDILERSATNELTQEFTQQIAGLAIGFGRLIQRAYSLIAKIKTSLT